MIGSAAGAKISPAKRPFPDEKKASPDPTNEMAVPTNVSAAPSLTLRLAARISNEGLVWASIREPLRYTSLWSLTRVAGMAQVARSSGDSALSAASWSGRTS